MAGSLTKDAERAGPFYAHARGEDRHVAHLVPSATSAQDAALQFAEHWLPNVTNGADSMSIIVRDAETGHEQCFMIDLDSGDAAPCA